MSEFSEVTVVREANVYFDGKVTSRTVKFEDGTKKTLGFMQAGEYSFDTGVAEVMEIIGVPENSKFDLMVKEFADYCCSYL